MFISRRIITTNLKINGGLYKEQDKINVIKQINLGNSR